MSIICPNQTGFMDQTDNVDLFGDNFDSNQP